LSSQGIQLLLGAHDHLGAARDHLLAYRAIRVVAVDQVEEIRRDRQRQLLVRVVAAGLLVVRERHVALELLPGRYAVLQLPDPVSPLGLGDVLPKSLTFKP